MNSAFATGDVKRALTATPESIADRLIVAGTPDDWSAWLSDTYAAAGLNHALVSFADPFTLRCWADAEVSGLPSLCAAGPSFRGGSPARLRQRVAFG